MVNQLSPVVLERLALIVCTRDRTTSLIDLLNSIASCGEAPKVVVIVDSNSTDVTAHAISQRGSAGLIAIQYLRSEPGLPYQRNLGIAAIIESPKFRSCEVIAFLDDDVEVSEAYFSNLLNLFDEYPKAIGIGGIDLDSPKLANESLWLRAALVSSHKFGAVLSSGCTTPPDPSARIVRTDWFPGFAMAFRRTVFENHFFNDHIAFYGEDLEFQLRIRSFGDFIVSNRLFVRHKNDPTSRDSIRDKWSYSDGFRWALSRRADNRVSSIAVLYSTLCLLAFECVRYLLTRRHESKLAFMGHVDFLSRLIRGKEVQKLRPNIIEKRSFL